MFTPYIHVCRYIKTKSHYFLIQRYSTFLLFVLQAMPALDKHTGPSNYETIKILHTAKNAPKLKCLHTVQKQVHFTSLTLRPLSLRKRDKIEVDHIYTGLWRHRPSPRCNDGHPARFRVPPHTYTPRSYVLHKTTRWVCNYLRTMYHLHRITCQRNVRREIFDATVA